MVVEEKKLTLQLAVYVCPLSLDQLEEDDVKGTIYSSGMVELRKSKRTRDVGRSLS